MARKVYGSGFRPTFGYGHALAPESALGNHRTTPREASRERLNGLSEINLLDGRNTNRAWICPPELRFLVVRAEDFGAQQGLGQAYCEHQRGCPQRSFWQSGALLTMWREQCCDQKTGMWTLLEGVLFLASRRRRVTSKIRERSITTRAWRHFQLRHGERADTPESLYRLGGRTKPSM